MFQWLLWSQLLLTEPLPPGQDREAVATLQTHRLRKLQDSQGPSPRLHKQYAVAGAGETSGGSAPHAGERVPVWGGLLNDAAASGAPKLL